LPPNGRTELSEVPEPRPYMGDLVPIVEIDFSMIDNKEQKAAMTNAARPDSEG